MITQLSGIKTCLLLLSAFIIEYFLDTLTNKPGRMIYKVSLSAAAVPGIVHCCFMDVDKDYSV